RTVHRFQVHERLVVCRMQFRVGSRTPATPIVEIETRRPPELSEYLQGFIRRQERKRRGIRPCADLLPGEHGRWAEMSRIKTSEARERPPECHFAGSGPLSLDRHQT